MEELTPVTRQEKFLAAAAGSGTAPDPVTREEKFLKAIADNAASGGSSGGGVLVVTETDGTLNKTWQEIHDGGFGVIAVGDDTDISYMPITNVYRSGDEYGVGALNTTVATLVTTWYMASSADEYPELEQGGDSAPK